MRFHTQTGGSTLAAQQVENNIVRVTIQALAAVLGGTQSLHTNSFDEALGLPTEKSAKLALRTQQIIAYESGVTDVVDPLGGSYFIECLTDEIENAAWLYINKIDELGGAVAAIEAGFQQDEIEASAYEWAKAVENKEIVLVGVNKFTEEAPEPVEVFPIDPELEKNQIQRLKEFKSKRNSIAVEEKLQQLKKAALSQENLLYPMKEALKANATLGEVSDVLREVFGTYQPHH
jgi:methylmalonyl-CoA mutase N-terminal domain/subunit